MIREANLRSALIHVVNIAFLLAGLANIAAGVVAAWNAQAATAATFFGISLVLLLAATIDRFETLKGLGVEAKTRQLERKIDEADEVLQKVRQLAELTCASLVALYSKVGRISSAPHPRELYQTLQKVKGNLTDMGADKVDVVLAIRPGIQVLLFELARSLIKPTQDEVDALLKVQSARRGSDFHNRDPNDPERMQIQQVLDLGQQWVLGMREIHRWAVDDYPGVLVSAIKDAPLISTELRDSQLARIEALRSDIERLKASGELLRVDAWFLESDKVWQE